MQPLLFAHVCKHANTVTTQKRAAAPCLLGGLNSSGKTSLWLVWQAHQRVLQGTAVSFKFKGSLFGPAVLSHPGLQGAQSPLHRKQLSGCTSLSQGLLGLSTGLVPHAWEAFLTVQGQREVYLAHCPRHKQQLSPQEVGNDRSLRHLQAPTAAQDA